MASQRRLNEKEQQKIFTVLLNKHSNKFCADCQAKSPQWASIDFGIFICMNCAGAHRAIGPQNTRVRSTRLDVWQEDQVEFISNFENNIINAYFESNTEYNFVRPNINSSQNDLLKFVQNKYLKQIWANKSLANPLKRNLNQQQNPLPIQQNNNSQQTFNSQQHIKQRINNVDLMDMDVKVEPNKQKSKQIDLYEFDNNQKDQQSIQKSSNVMNDFNTFQFEDLKKSQKNIFDSDNLSNRKISQPDLLGFDYIDNMRKVSNSQEKIHVPQQQKFDITNLYNQPATVKQNNQNTNVFYSQPQQQLFNQNIQNLYNQNLKPQQNFQQQSMNINQQINQNHEQQKKIQNVNDVMSLY